MRLFLVLPLLAAPVLSACRGSVADNMPGSGAPDAGAGSPPRDLATGGGTPNPPTPPPDAAPVPLAFDESAADRVVLRNGYYELALSKDNGAILALVDKSTGRSVTRGSRNGCLWGTLYKAAPSYVGGCSFSAAGANQFSYRWDAATGTLTFFYRADKTKPLGVDAVVTLTASDGPGFGMQLSVTNHSGALMSDALVPSDLSFDDASVVAAFAPFTLPGARLGPGFFTANKTWVPNYPSDGAFADYLGLQLDAGRLSLYTINPSDRPIQPVALGFADDSANASLFLLGHTMHTWVADGASWLSPVVRIRVGQSPGDDMLAYRHDNGLDAYPSLQAKLGARFDTMARAVQMKGGPDGTAFKSMVPLLAQLPSPVILHPIGFQTGGHDAHGPDYLPPNPTLGTQADFKAWIDAAHARGDLVMPYINPTWWDPTSPTVAALPAGMAIKDIAVLDDKMAPVYETYGTHNGVVVSYAVRFVQDRLATLMGQWRDQLGADCLFEDQIGARQWRLDLNPASTTPLAYADGWLAHARQYADRNLMTEMGWDRLAQNEVGFNGSLLTWQRSFQYGDANFGAGNWSPHPLALWLFHDKVLMYQHDLGGPFVDNDKDALLWNLAYGNGLTYETAVALDPAHADQVDLAVALQQQASARYAGQAFLGYDDVDANVSRSRFQGVSVIANWRPADTFDVKGSRLAPKGFLVQSDDGALVAGDFTGLFNGAPLAAGEHYLVVTRTGSSVIVRQPVGDDTEVTVDAPTAATSLGALKVSATGRDGSALGAVGFDTPNGKIHFTAVRLLNGKRVASFTIQ